MKLPASTSLLLAVLAVAGCSSPAATTEPPPEADVVASTVATTAAPTTTTTAASAAPKSPTTLPATTTSSTTSSTTTSTTLPPLFTHSVEPVTEEVVWASWREGCPLHYSELSLLTLSYWDFGGEATTGQLVINTAVVDDIVAAFEGLFELKFPIERIELVDDYGGDDKAAMAANVTSGFNCRFVDGTDRWSNHAVGLAVDINPLLNPWAREGNVLPTEGEPYADRSVPLPGMINLGDEPIAIFEAVGWSWGGIWQSADYMHFSKPGN